MKKIIRLILSMCLSTLTLINFAHAQDNLPPLSVTKVVNIESYLSKYYKVPESFTDTVCTNTVVFMRFKITDDHIDSLSFSINAPPIIQEALQSAILATNGFWKSNDVEKKQMKDKVFLLPAIFYYNSGCSPGGQIVTSPTKPDLSVMLRSQTRFGPMQSALSNMMKFKNVSEQLLLDCVLISPMTFFGKIY